MKNTKAIIIAAILVAIIILAIVIVKNQRENTELIDPQNASDVITLDFGHDMPVSSSQHEAAVRFADIVNYKSKGKIEIKIHPDQQLGTDQEMIEMAQLGKLAIILPPTAKMSTLVPEMQLLDLPFLVLKRDDMYDILDGEPGKILLNKLFSHGLIGVTFWESGFKQFTTNKEIHHPEDFKGLNIRTMKSRIIMDQFINFGANPIPIDFKKTYQAIKDGVVDGQENSLVSIASKKFYEVQSQITISNHAYLAQAVVFSKKIIDSLSPGLQEILISTAKEITPFQRNETISKEADILNLMEKHNTQIYKLNTEELTRFQNISRNLVEKFKKIDSDLLDITEQLLKEKVHSDENEIIIGLNADLVASSSLAGQSIKRGMELAVNEINENGGVLGKKFRIIAKDNSGISAQGIDNMKFFSKLNNMVAVMCGIYSPIALAELEIVHQEKIILLNPWAAATKIVDNGYKPNYVFRVSVRDEFAGPFLVKKALQKHKKVALLLVNDGWGKGNLSSISTALSKKDMKPVAIEWFNWGEKSMKAQLQRIEDAGADVIIMVAGVSEGISIIKNMSERSIKPPIISHWGITGGHFWKAVNRELENVSLKFLQSYSFMDISQRKGNKLKQSYYEAYNIDHPGKIFAPVGTAHAYDLVYLLKLAIEKAGTIDRPTVRNALEQINQYSGVVKNYAPPFTPSRHDALNQSSFFLAEYDKHGYIIPISK